MSEKIIEITLPKNPSGIDCQDILLISSSSISLLLVLSDSASGLGFNIRGGVDHPHLSYDPGIFVTSVRQNGVAARNGQMHPGDKILEVS